MTHVNLVKEPNAPLAYAPGLKLHHPIMSKLGEPMGQLERDIILLLAMTSSSNPPLPNFFSGVNETIGTVYPPPPPFNTVAEFIFICILLIIVA